jgi:hypothetical protein
MLSSAAIEHVTIAPTKPKPVTTIRRQPLLVDRARWLESSESAS